MIEGIEQADSFVVNPHKWLFTNFDCSAYFLRDPEALTCTFAYLRSREGERVIDYRDWGIPLGRRFRALKLWFVIRSYGVAGLRRMIAAHIDWARALARRVEAEPDFELLSPCRLALFTFRYRPAGLDDEAELERLNQRLIEAVNDSGALYLTGTRVGGRTALRFAVGQTTTTEAHVARAWERIAAIARAP